MENAVKIDSGAFARGVDEVLQLKPLRRVASKILDSKAAKLRISTPSSSPAEQSGSGGVQRSQ
ncbi:MAG: hypothetical protein GDA55_08180 [Cellvibrionales bacterium]|nr:hypothetical protein [Cellvibrionales bacterium]